MAIVYTEHHVTLNSIRATTVYNSRDITPNYIDIYVNGTGVLRYIPYTSRFEINSTRNSFSLSVLQLKEHLRVEDTRTVKSVLWESVIRKPGDLAYL